MRPILLAGLAAMLLAPTARAGSSNSLVDVSPDGGRLAVANTDSGTVSIVDLKARKTVAEVVVGDHPEGVSWVPGTSLVLAAVYGDDVVKVIDADKKSVTRTIPVADEPYGVVVTRDGKFAYVSHDYPGTVAEIDLATFAVKRTFAASKEKAGCRGLALSPDEKTLYATEFFTAALVAVDRASGKVADRWPADAQDNLARHVTIHPTRPKAYLAHLRSRVTGFDARGSIFPQISFCDLVPEKGAKRRRAISLDTFNGLTVVTNPWETALSPDGSRLYSVYAGTDDMNVSKVLGDDYEELTVIGRVLPVGRHPRAVRVSPSGKEVYVYATLDYAVNVFDETGKKRLASIAVATPAHTAEWRRGKELFQTALQPMGSARWIACSSCHPDGLTDSRVWQNPEGHRKTPNLFGMAHTHPLHWSGDRDESQDFEYTVRGKLMQGRGLAKQDLKPRTKFAEFAENEQTTAGLSVDLDALAVYCNSFPVRLSPHVASPGKLTPEAARGQVIFASAKTRCATCHTGDYYTDSRLAKPFKRHDVGTGTGPDEKVGPEYDTPTLLGSYRVTSYLHDGRAKTLEEVFTTFNKGDQHGTTGHLTPAEVGELAAFVRSLPFTPPPDTTPNTVKHRIVMLPSVTPKDWGADPPGANP